MITLLLPHDTHLGLPCDPETHEPRWREMEEGIEATYTAGELGAALACAGKGAAALRLMGAGLRQVGVF